MNKALFSSASDQWATPPDFFEALDAEFHFDLDPCADETNHKTPDFFTKEENGLLKDWGGGASSVIHHTGEVLGNGSKNASERATKTGRSSSFSYRPGRIRSIFTIIY